MAALTAVAKQVAAQPSAVSSAAALFLVAATARHEVGEETHHFYVYLASALGSSGRCRAQHKFIMCDVFHQADDGALAEMELRLRRDEFVPCH